MNEKKDNKLENIFFEIILNNTQLNWEIIKIYDLINSQNISFNDRKIIIEKIFWFLIINEDEEINTLLKTIKNDNIKKYLLYKLVFELIEWIFNIDDKEHLDLLLSNTKEEIETDIIYFLRDIFELLYKKIKKYLEKRIDLNDLYSKDYLDENEIKILLNEIETLFGDIIIEVNRSEEKKKIEEKIKAEIDKKYKILNIK